LPSYDHAVSVSAERPFSLAPARTQSRKWLAILLVLAEWLALAAGTGYLCARTLPRAWQSLNTDFPNYYLTARLLREGYNTDRLYEWIWIQRQKDRVGIEKTDQPVVAFVPLTPFSSLVVWPLTYWAPLTAKHIWIVLNLLLLGAVAVLLHSLTGLAWRRISLLMVLCFPLHRNLLYGQYYILLLLLITLALWLYVRQKRVSAGLLLGIGFGLKIFPVFFLLYFLRKRDFTAAAAVLAGSIATVLTSIAAFGVALNRVYFLQVLPWALRGEGMDPYNLSASSLSSLLHRLFVFEPEWNPHPLIHAPAVFATLHPLLQMLVLAPAILLMVPRDMRPKQVRLEWAALLVAVLAISTLPASYHFTLLILPVAIIASGLIRDRSYRALAVLLILYLGVCFPLWRTGLSDSTVVLAAPRLYFMILLCLFSYWLLWRERGHDLKFSRECWAWSGALACVVMLQIAATLHHQRGIYEHYSARLTTAPGVFLATEPTPHRGSLEFIAMLADGYHTGERTQVEVHFDASPVDRLALTAAGDRRWVEESHHASNVISFGSDPPRNRTEVENAEFPVASADGQWLAYLRSEHGTSRMWLRSLQGDVPDTPVTPDATDVWEMAFLPDDSIIFAASVKHARPHIFIADHGGDARQLGTQEARYPSVSPDGQWLAYSRLQNGVWNLWLRNVRTGQENELTSAQCNDISPAWEADSKTLVFASDCGRSLGLTALHRQRVVP
jgi:hypothetical protein